MNLLPRRDTAMALILLAVMGLMDVAALATNPAMVDPPRAPSLLILPGTLALIWVCYSATLAMQARHYGRHATFMTRSGVFMGWCMSVVGAVMTVGYLGLVGGMAGWFVLNNELFVRGFVVAMSVTLILMHNGLPKFIASCATADGPPVMIRGLRLTGWVGVLSGLVMVGIALTVPLGHMVAPLLCVAILPNVLIAGNTLIWWLEHRRGSRP